MGVAISPRGVHGHDPQKNLLFRNATSILVQFQVIFSHKKSDNNIIHKFVQKSIVYFVAELKFAVCILWVNLHFILCANLSTIVV